MITAKNLLESLNEQEFNLQIKGEAIRISPRALLTDKIRILVKSNKQLLLAALQNRHLEKKQLLGHRIGTLQLCLRRCYGNSWKDEPSSWARLNQWLDQILIDWNYDLEGAIGHYGSLTPEPTYFCKCGLKAPFCSCVGSYMLGAVKCILCVHFKPDACGSGGIGSCGNGIEFTVEAGRHRPLYPNSWRHCDKFRNKPEEKPYGN